MAYNAIAQLDHEVASVSSASASPCPSPTHKHAFEQLPLDTDHIGGGSHLETAKTTENPTFSRLGSMIRSMTAASYDVVEDDDYDADPSPEERANSLRIPPLNTTARNPSPERPIHSACSEVPVPLSHPTPDLQSIQGAYKGNVTRLEQSAEQLSSSSADIESEIRRMDQEQKRRSVSSASNSIHRTGAFSPVATISSAHGSIASPGRQRSVSGARLAQLAEPAHEEEPEVDEFPGLPDLPPAQPLFNTQSDYYYDQYVPQGVPAEPELQRRASVASFDTYQQARTLFTDFDGVHFTPLEPGRQVSLEQPPLARNPDHYKNPRAGENMVFYPAPVPRMLNLPPKLSRRENIDRDKRRTQIAGAIAAQDRKSTVGLPDAVLGDSRDSHNDKRKSTVPPHLRASVFFDQPSTSLQVEVKQQSAVATLESILDASANAPVSAFTDHPYAGQVGAFIYNTSKRKTLTKDPTVHKTNRLSRAIFGQSYNTNNVEEDEVPATLRHGSDDSDRNDDEHGHERGPEGTDGESEESEDEGSDDADIMDYVGPPNTLIAELELRKHELKHRRRTIVPVPFRGMRSTLLEMDDMVQKQSDNRRQRPVALAWEGRDDDDDVPLAMLYPEKTNIEEDRPLGLLAMRHQEENEPLSSRRARLRGEPIPRPEQRPVTMYAEPPAHVPEPAAESEDETEVETLAERVQRLKGHKRSESKFASDLMAEIDTRAGVAPKEPEEVPVPIEEETLAQRRSRLRKEAAAAPAAPKNPRMRRSMAALTQGRPSHLSRQSSYDVFNQRPVTMSQFGNRMSMQQFPTQMRYPPPVGYPMAQQYGYPINPAMMGMNGVGYAPNMVPPGPVKTEVIDRWRQSIR
ncbi:hypothetical protein DTO006G1_1851 [Penicillium roqueforti]|uniref:uncharacterized protein n=2 Tax=Penicillium TaxID=5073 RepID=UPI00190917C7|nr:uncharacterized protein LCP9604111_3558 [Penicillium roqueforti]KAF9250042.1 hypothetical protein LCP9604111_3558 [Penicillium roqueforti]KAI1831554.1 hypothetical protein CBS147337_7710 [Penicillium roqueforti]KAI2679493.1 hypothetical protein CBS147355_3975 [Penicillium roqueforti]KAI2684565.1 hypothetical protein LCP963914a_5297 [Penicillium roqueforti]KAI2701115.1 hypothetical protein CBS147372_5185 [Penicillium roqueforti]